MSDSGNSEKSICVVIPVYQNQDTIFPLYAEIRKTEAYKRGILHCVFVDDGSTDASYSKLLELRKTDAVKIQVVKLSRNFGQISAIMAGLKYVIDSHAVIISADLQDPPTLIDQMLSNLSESQYLVVAEREGRAEKGFKSIASNLYWRAVAKYALPGYPKGGFDFCLLHQDLVRLVQNCPEKNTQIFPLIYYMGYKPKVIKYFRQERAAGESQWTFWKKFKLFVDTFISFSYVPIRSISVFGILLSFFSMTLAILIAFDYLYRGNPYTGWTSIVVILLFIGGAILLTLGLIGEYLWRILDQVRPRPGFIVEKVHSFQNE
ncbi:MAG: glycosyltransferase family 2 protein [Bdellovibrionales bacterium]|nr:glycosyltransferase family 2 protein [Bdellovibrionales bacterium]